MTRAEDRRQCELRCLGALVMHPWDHAKVSRFVQVEHFATPEHRELFELLGKIGALGEEAMGNDDFMVWFPRDGKFTKLAAEAAVAATNKTQTLLWARHVAAWHAIESTAKRSADMAATLSQSWPGAHESIERLMLAHAEFLHESVKLVSAQDREKTRSEAIEEFISNIGKPPNGLRTGLAAIDDILAPIRYGSVVVPAARTGIGKTTFALNVALSVARAGYAVQFFSLEMTVQNMLERLTSLMAGVNSERARRGEINADEKERLIQAATEIERLDIAITELKDATPEAIAVEVRRHRPRLVVVDYIQRLHVADAESRVAEVARISSTLKDLALETECVVLAVSQLSRESEGEKPSLKHLRWASEIEQDADAVVLLWNGKDTPLDEIEYEVAKHRHGRTGSGRLRYDRETYHMGNTSGATPV